MSSWGSSRTDGAASLTEVSSTRVSESLRSKVPVPSGHEFLLSPVAEVTVPW